MVKLTFDIHHSEISLLTFEPFDTQKSNQTLQTKQSINQSIIQSINQSKEERNSELLALCLILLLTRPLTQLSDSLVVHVLLCLQVNLPLLSAPGPL